MKCAVVGNSVASLVALDLLRQNHENEVTWIQEGSLPSGVWRGIQFNGQTIDLGMMNFEVDLPNNCRVDSLHSYDLFSINSCANFVRQVSEYLESKVELTELPKIKIFSDGGYFSDFIISNDLTDLAKYLEPTNQDREFKSDVSLTHPSKKYELIGYEDFESSFDSYAERMYPPSFHEKVLHRWGSRLLGEMYRELQTTRHRSGWLPLYYPETLMEAVIDGTSLKPYSFHYPRMGSISKMWVDLSMELNCDEVVVKENLVDFNKKEDLADFEHIIWGSSRQQFNRVFQPASPDVINFKRGKIDLDYYLIPEAGFEYCTLNLSSGLDSWYRSTLSPNYQDSLGNQLLCVESKSSPSASQAEPTRTVTNLSLEAKDKVIEFKGIPVFSVPTDDEIEESQSSILDLIKNYKRISFVGPALMPFAQTMNDQIIQGMKASNE